MAFNLFEDIEVFTDTQKIVIGSNEYRNALTKPREELVSWLYCLLHIGNPNLINHLGDAAIYKDDSDKEIDERIKYTRLPFDELPYKDGAEFLKVNGIDLVKNEGNFEFTIPCYRPRLSPGFLMFRNFLNDVSPLKIRRYYLWGSKPREVKQNWSRLVLDLYDQGLNFSSKVLAVESQYPRTDAMVIYCDSQDHKSLTRVESVLKMWPLFENAAINRRSIFTTPIAPNCPFTFADELEDTSKLGMSYGQHMCAIVADSILDSLLTEIPVQITLKWRFNQSHLSEVLSTN